MAKIAVLYCKKVKDHSCMGCAKSIDFDSLKATVQEKFGVEMVLGTHAY
jgi:hypothetical protein